MLFSGGRFTTACFEHQNKKIPKSKDNVVQNVHLVFHKRTGLIRSSGKNICFFIHSIHSNRKCQGNQGSITTEAALILPLFLMAITAMFVFFNAMAFELKMQGVLNQVGTDLSWYSALPEEVLSSEGTDGISRIPGFLVTGILSETVVKPMVLSEMEKKGVPFDLVLHGKDGISFLGSHYDTKKKDIVLLASYQIQIPFFQSDLFAIQVTHGIRHRAWVGAEVKEEKEDVIYVYITKTGTVYHKDVSCTYINLSVHEIPASTVFTARNQSGQKYTACERCNKTAGTVYFVTDYGDRYHSDRNCSSILRDVRRVPLSEVQDRRPCSKCGGN